MSREIIDYIAKQPDDKQEIIQCLRQLIQKALPVCVESMRWGVISFQGGKFYLASMKTCIHMGFTIQGLEEEVIKTLEGSGKTMRHLKFFSLEDVDEEKVASLIKVVDQKGRAPAR